MINTALRGGNAGGEVSYLRFCPRRFVFTRQTWDCGRRGSLDSLLNELPWGWWMPSMRAVLEARRKAAVVRVEELEAELEQVRADLANAEEILNARIRVDLI
ncbi:hypothetical protein [Streptomyces sp. NPDC059378]|uniref:hypothetical protein n=1 Tax=Streptomyces sp. NPDC059378 TaxID=3346815 RepID=UPI003699FBD0